MILTFLGGRIQEGSVCLPEEFLKWYGRMANVTGLDLPTLGKPAARSAADAFSIGGRTVRLTREMLERQERPSPPPSALQKRLDWVARVLKLGRSEKRCLAALYRLTQLDPFRQLANALTEHFGERDEVPMLLVGSVVGIRGRQLESIFERTGQLQQLGLIDDRRGGDFAPSEFLLKLLRRRTTSPKMLEELLVGQTRTSSLKLTDFDHLGTGRDETIRILSGSLRRRTLGANFLFHGPPGTGKTEFAALLGKVCNARVVFAGEMGGEQREPDRADRLAHLSLLSAIAARAGRIIVVVDEADDIFTGVDDARPLHHQGSKAFINRLVETCPAPTIWITNHPQRLGEPVLRRMLRAIEFRMPGMEVRRRIVERHAKALDLEIDAGSRERIAAIDTSPGVIAAGLKAARIGSGGGTMALSAAISLETAMGRRIPSQAPKAPVEFDAALSSADTDLLLLARQVKSAGTSALSFLLTGPSGTGKSAYARHLATHLGLQVLQKRGSDLLGMFVGETEARIAHAFEEAAEFHKFLIFDEVDSLLADRRSAQRNWEASQVNEMLTWMESHGLPFAATSNLEDRLDPAVQRRFLFKVRFAPMAPTQIDLAFQRFFGSPAPQCICDLDGLTPGDFAVVARKAKILNKVEPAEIAAMLAVESRLKSGSRNPIGFLGRSA